MTSVQEFRLEATQKLTKAAEAQLLLRTSLALANEQIASLTSQLAALGPPSEELQRTLDQVRNELLTVAKATTTEYETVAEQAQKLATLLQWLWPWMQKQSDQVWMLHRKIMTTAMDREHTVLATLRTSRTAIAAGLVFVILTIGATTWLQWNKIDAVQQANAMCRAGERLVAAFPKLRPEWQEWSRQNLFSEPAPP